MIKNLETNYRKVPGVSGATILGDGRVGTDRRRRRPRAAPAPEGRGLSRAESSDEHRKQQRHRHDHEYLTFTLGSEEYGVDILKVQEIRGYDQVTRLPGAPDFVKGAINLRGLIVPVVDMRLKFELSNATYDDTTVMIVLKRRRPHDRRGRRRRVGRCCAWTPRRCVRCRTSARRSIASS